MRVSIFVTIIAANKYLTRKIMFAINFAVVIHISKADLVTNAKMVSLIFHTVNHVVAQKKEQHLIFVTKIQKSVYARKMFVVWHVINV